MLQKPVYDDDEGLRTGRFQWRWYLKTSTMF
jgi:hypothetical protein